MSTSPLYLAPIIVPLGRGDTILDVGCGYGRWGALLRTAFHSFGLDHPPTIDGCDGFEPNVEWVRGTNLYRRVWHAVMPCDLPRRAYDTVLAVEILEHCRAEDTEPFLDRLEEATRGRVIVTFPNWNYLRPGGDTAVGFNPLEAHLCRVDARLLRRRGYRLIGAGFGNPDNLLTRIVGRLISPRRGLADAQKHLASTSYSWPWLAPRWLPCATSADPARRAADPLERRRRCRLREVEFDWMI